MSADFFSFALVVPEDVALRLLSAIAPTETTYQDNVYLDCDVSELLEGDVAGEEPRVVMSSNYPVFVALDRFVAAGALLEGRAFRHLPLAQLAGWRKAWTRKDPASLVEQAAARLDRGGGATAEVREALEVIDSALDAAAAAGHDVVLACVAA